MSRPRGMNHREWLLAAIGTVLLAVSAQMVRMSHGPMRDIVLAQACRTPVRILEAQGRERIGYAVVFHGLSANRRLMQILSQHLAGAGLRVYLADSPGHGDNPESFSFARAETCAADAVEELERRGEIQQDRTVLVGHSMGGAVAIRLADRFSTAATIAISPAPMVRGAGMPANMLHFNLPRRMPVNLLVIVGGSEPSVALAAARPLLQAAGGERFDQEDFQQKRAAKLEVIPRATHTSSLFDSRVEEMSSRWAHDALEKNSPWMAISRGSPAAGGILGLAGLMLLFPLATSALVAAFRAAASEPLHPPPVAGRVLARWAIAALFAVVVLRLWVPLRALRIFTGDYLASFLLIASAVLLVVPWKHPPSALGFEPRALTAACVLGLTTMLVFGAWLDWQLTDAWMTAARWWRFAPVLLVCLPYFLAEENALGPPGAGRRLRRFVLFLSLRATLFLALVIALFALGSGQILIVLLAMYLAAFSLVQRLGADAVRRRTGSAAAAAAFGAILAAWFLTAVLPLT